MTYQEIHTLVYEDFRSHPQAAVRTHMAHILPHLQFWLYNFELLLLLGAWFLKLFLRRFFKITNSGWVFIRKTNFNAGFRSVKHFWGKSPCGLCWPPKVTLSFLATTQHSVIFITRFRQSASNLSEAIAMGISRASLAKRAFNNYVDQILTNFDQFWPILTNFDPLHPRVDKRGHFTSLPPCPRGLKVDESPPP